MFPGFRSKTLRHICLILCICVCQFFIILPLLCFRLPFSPYFQLSPLSKTMMEGKVKAANQQRLRNSVKYFDGQTPGENIQYYDRIRTSSLYLTVAIITVSRTHGRKENEGLGYVIQSAEGLDTFAKSHQFNQKTFVFVCNVDAKPADHKDANYLKSYLPFVERYGSSSFNVPDIRLPNSSITYRQRTHNSTYEKETFDYTFCLNVAKSFNSDFVLMVEDDAIPHKDLATVLDYSLNNHIIHRSPNGITNREFVYLKLYYPEKWQGYAYEFYRILELLCTGYVGGGIYLLFIFICLKTSRTKSDIIFGHFIFGVVFFILTAELIGRQNVIELRRLSKYFYQFRPSPGCCTPAMLYPSAIVDRLTSYLTSVEKSVHTDLALADFVKLSGIPAFQLEPNLFYHIGMYTSLNKRDKDPLEFII